ncbi:MAG: aminotransferase class I/II-fold pyridoxal phosphate-dependent enzyme, partial [Candidatus Omnitrophica bacterium]|nr:aminotransferase class I/II-fold pyridoxal phosphate-dependent enzyme [Candidatus Omnitrophota bacterium]
MQALPRQAIDLSWDEFRAMLTSLGPAVPGPTTERFEREIADFVGASHAVSFGSQRSGMYAVLKALEPREGDEVIVPAYTFFSVPACVVLAGLKPVFVDVDPVTWNLDPEKVRGAITPKTRAIVVTHLNGC